VKSFKLAVIVAAVTVTSGCTTLKGWFADDNSLMETRTDRNELVIPKEYSNPKRSNEYTLPEVSVAASDNSEITSPTSVLVIFEKSWINEDDEHPSKIMVEKPDLIDDFSTFIHQGIQSYSEQRNAKVTKVSDTQYQVVYPVFVETGFWFWKNNVKAEELVYELNVEMQPHGRSGEIFINPISYERFDNELASDIPHDLRKDALAVYSLNDVMLELDYLYRVVVKKEQSTLDVTLALTEDVSGNTVISSQQDIVYVWSQMEDIVEQLGFSIEEEDEDLHTYTLSYERGEQSTWDSIFNADYANKIEIESGTYELMLTTSVDGVQMKFKDKLGNLFTPEQMKQTFDLIMAIVKDEELEI